VFSADEHAYLALGRPSGWPLNYARWSDIASRPSEGKAVKLRPRHVVLSAEALEFFKEQSKDKLPGAPLFTEDGETPWRRHVWARQM
jgi:hypothetical protein